MAKSEFLANAKVRGFIFRCTLINFLGGVGLLLAIWGKMLFWCWSDITPRLAYLSGMPMAPDKPCNRPGCDFSIFWTAGHLADSHSFAQLYAPDLFNHAAQKLLLPAISYESFIYPPPTLLIFDALAHLPFEFASLCWLGVGIFASTILLRLAGFSWAVITAGLLSPAALLNYQQNQFGELTGAILLASIALSQRRQAIGGAIGGVLMLKPQLGLLLPFHWLRESNWRALGALTGVSTVMLVLSLLMFGTAPWRGFLTQGGAEATRILYQPYDPHSYQGWGISVFWMARSFGAGVSTARLLQGACILAAIILVILRKRENTLEWLVLLAPLTTPYGFCTDMVAYSVVLALRMERGRWRMGLLDAILFLWPGLCFNISIATGHELTPLIVLAALLRAALPARLPVLPARAQE